MMLIHESHLFEVQIETNFEVCDPRGFFLMRAFQPVTPLGKLFKNEHIEFPSNKVNKWLSKFLSVSGEGQPFFELHCDRVKVLHDLNSAYYVFDVCGQQ